jgi:putative ABC transport system substrate-binding protein
MAAAQHATSTVPIVMAPATDPVGSCFIKSLAHPGGNITGMANMFGDAIGKSVELLHTMLPSAKRVAVPMSTNPTHPQESCDVSLPIQFGQQLLRWPQGQK